MATRTQTYSIPSLLLLAMLGGCAGGASSSSPQGLLALPAALTNASQGHLRSARSLPPLWIYTAQLYGEDVKVYQRNGLSLTYYETLTPGVASPYGTVTTPDGRWYVANGGHSNVLVYRTTKYGPQGPVEVLDDYGEMPVNVTVTSSRRLVAVSNAHTMIGGAGSVSIYLNRNAEPARILRYGAHLLAGAGIALDRHGNCYWSFNDPIRIAGSIVEFAGCNGTGKLVVSGIAKAGGVAFDQHDDLYYVDQTSGIYKCQGTSKCALFANGFGAPENINFDHNHGHLWVADATGYIDAVNPATGAIEYSIEGAGGPHDPPFGIAPAPGG
ncbi:MAG: hypothetical protein WB609_05835 [Candidatus Cybelea sp.]